MNNQFVKSIFDNIVEENLELYKNLYATRELTDKTVDYWKNSIQLYQSFNENQKKIFFRILKQTMIDTISNLFGVLDGTTTLSEKEYDIFISINGVNSNNELQETFLECVEDNITDIFR